MQWCARMALRTWCSWIDEFWTAATSCRLRPELVTLVPKNVLDGRYAYFLLTKAD